MFVNLPEYLLYLGPQEILIIILIIALLIWGPTQLPKLARALGQAKKEFEKGSKGEGETDIYKLAKELGIETEGKTEEEIKNEIIKRVKK